MRHTVVFSLLVGLAALPATAQQIADCDSWVANARNLSRPLEDATRSFSNGAISFIALDTGGEPACCSAHLMVLYPDPELPEEICALVQLSDGLGYMAMSLPDATADYDPARGLRVRVPVRVFDEAEGRPVSLDVTVNQQTGVIRATHGAP